MVEGRPSRRVSHVTYYVTSIANAYFFGSRVISLSEGDAESSSLLPVGKPFSWSRYATRSAQIGRLSVPGESVGMVRRVTSINRPTDLVFHFLRKVSPMRGEASLIPFRSSPWHSAHWST